jgi:hypothetical protein
VGVWTEIQEALHTAVARLGAPGQARTALSILLGCGSKFAAEDRRHLAAVLRCIVGNPFRRKKRRAFPAHVTGLARSIYDTFPAVSPEYAVLADALEEVGEADAAAHCRTELHAKGCFVLDWITGRS